MSRLDELIQAYYGSRNGELLIEGTPVSVLAERHGTPAYVYSRSVLERKWDQLRAALPAEFSLYYSVKANPHPEVLRCFLAKGAGLEIASAGEYEHARQAGCAGDKILFAGPGKTESELETVLKGGIEEIHLESLVEAERVSRLARKLGRSAPVALRINPSADAQGGAMRMGGRPAPFGVDEEVLDSVLDRLLEMPALDLRGIHIFAGTQILDLEILAAQYNKGLQLGIHVADRLNRPLRTIDFGGGLGIPYFEHEHALNLAGLGDLLRDFMGRVRANKCFAETRFILEPGRYLAGEGGIYLARVTDIKISRGKKFLILDGGMHHHLAASGNLGQTIKRNYPIAVLNRLDESPDESVEIVGPLCTPLDTLGRGVSVPRTEIGDLVGVFQSGAYGRSASPIGFLSHPPPIEVWVDAKSRRSTEIGRDPD